MADRLVRVARNICLLVPGLAILLALTGASYQMIGQWADARRSPEPGRLVDIGGYKLKLNCTGSGSPTVVLESGLGDVSIGWRRVQPEIAQSLRVCSYDRAGYGGSDPGPMPRTSLQIATELHALLHRAGEPAPYLLVGHSFGGYNIRVFTGQYPDEVAGLVLVDSTQEDEYELLPVSWQKVGAALTQHFRKTAKWAPLLIHLGIARWMLRRGATQWDYLILQTKYLRARASELDNMRMSAEQARAADHITTKPLVVLAAGSSAEALVGGGFSRQDAEDFQRVWDELQIRLARLSQCGQRHVVPASGHDIPAEHPEAIVEAVHEVLAIGNAAGCLTDSQGN